MQNDSKTSTTRLREYSILTIVCACCLTAGFYGFVDTGGPYPIEEKFQRGILQEPLEPRAGPVVDLSQGVTVAAEVDSTGDYFSVAMAFFIFGGILFAVFAALHDIERERRI